ncbi:MAG: ATP-binding protein [Anaerovoracaceae bacterium]
MKHVSFVNKLTIWYSIILIVIAIGSMTLMYEMAKQSSRDAATAVLVEQVSDAESRIVSSGREFEYSSGIKYYSSNVYVSVYDEGGVLVEGRRPAAVSGQISFADGEYQSVQDSDGGSWYIYDSLCTVDGRKLWIRGITSAGLNRVLHGITWQTSALIMIALLVSALVIGRLIAVRSIKPVRDVVATVEEIRRSGDLSKRVEAPKGDDIGQLAGNFNSLFDKVEQMIETEKKFTSDISHELKTPLAVIASQSEYALEDEEYRPKALGIINDEAMRMSEMISRLRLLAGSDSNNLKLHREVICLSEILASIAEQQALIGRDEGVEIVSDIEENVMVNADITMLIRAILNLVDNGIKYAGEGSRIIIGLRSDGEYAVCTVSDNGPGIREENLDRIWDRFYREDESRSSRESWGLGLSMVKAIVEAHGGTVFASSPPGEGCTFTIKLEREDSAHD